MTATVMPDSDSSDCGKDGVAEAVADSHMSLMRALPRRHDLIGDLIGGRSFHYVDIPVHGNIGDLLIMHGTMQFFKGKKLTPKNVAPAFAFCPEWVQPGEAVVFHGGGNFGDLYWESGSQRLREEVAATLPSNRIIVLPQTLHFSSPRQKQRSAQVFRGHSDVHICVRDESSRQMALEFSDHVHLLPDMAHQLYPVIAERSSVGSGVLHLSRTDGERLDAAGVPVTGAATRIDWPQMVGDRERHIDRFRRAMRLLFRSGLGKVSSSSVSNAWVSYSGMLIDSAVEVFAQHELVITDRLHGHILACLMNQPSTVMDNFYGKNSGYVDCWTAASELVSFPREQRNRASMNPAQVLE